MENPFSPDYGPDISLKRNAYDLSRMGLFTTEIGQISPLLSMEVLPGDTVKIDSSQINIQGMPTLYPLQTRLKVSASFYYGRNRTVHDNFEDFIFNTKDIEAPWLKLNNERAKKMISTGSLGDMLGVPTTIGTDTEISDTLIFGEVQYDGNGGVFSYSSSNVINYYSSRFSEFYLVPFASRVDSAFSFVLSQYIDHIPESFEFMGVCNPNFISVSILENDPNFKGMISVTRADGKSVFIFVPVSMSIVGDSHECAITYSVSDDLKSLISKLLEYGPIAFGLVCSYFSGNPSVQASPSNVLTWDYRGNYYSFDYSFSVSRVHDATEDAFISSNPFVGSSPQLKISAYKFRLYEQICNYYYRNDKNNPYVLNGEVQYNEFIPTHADGADENLYDFHYRNWELDRFTSATQTPQFGEAPLVGITYNPLSERAVMTFQTTDSDGNLVSSDVTVGVDREGKISEIADFDRSIPSANLRKLEETINYGISINDLRVTNSFQRFLENTLRRGLRYRNQLKSHFGTSVDYPDIDIPQYIGGFSGEFTVGRVESTADTEGAPLGDFTGKLFGQFSQKHTISKYIPEHGFIFCMFSISPIPQYPQCIDKSLLKTSYLDYFLPEFGKSMGHVPLEYAEVCPLQNRGVGESVHDIFGYQRYAYEYMMAFDEVHGDFRTNLKDFAMLRTYKERPDLCEDFTVIKPVQVNDVFVTRNIASENNSSKHFLGNYYFHIIVARPIPKVGTPSLE